MAPFFCLPTPASIRLAGHLWPLQPRPEQGFLPQGRASKAADRRQPDRAAKCHNLPVDRPSPQKASRMPRLVEIEGPRAWDQRVCNRASSSMTSTGGSLWVGAPRKKRAAGCGSGENRRAARRTGCGPGPVRPCPPDKGGAPATLVEIFGDGQRVVNTQLTVVEPGHQAGGGRALEPLQLLGIFQIEDLPLPLEPAHGQHQRRSHCPGGSPCPPSKPGIPSIASLHGLFTGHPAGPWHDIR